MKNLPGNKIVVPLGLLLVAAVSLASSLRSSQFEELKDRIAALESVQRQLVTPAPISTAGPADEDINDLYAQIASLREQLATRGRAAHSGNNENVQPLPTLVESEATNTESVAVSTAAEIFATGYVNDQTWAAAEESLEEMSIEESKQFWQKMFTGIEDGSIEVYLGQE